LYTISVAITALVLLPALISLIVTVYRVISPAPTGDASLEAGAWLALAAAISMFVGAWKGASDEGPARRTPERERRVAAEGIEASELLTLPEDGGTSEPEPVQG